MQIENIIVNHKHNSVKFVVQSHLLFGLPFWCFKLAQKFEWLCVIVDEVFRSWGCHWICSIAFKGNFFSSCVPLFLLCMLILWCSNNGGSCGKGRKFGGRGNLLRCIIICWDPHASQVAWLILFHEDASIELQKRYMNSVRNLWIGAHIAKAKNDQTFS